MINQKIIEIQNLDISNERKKVLQPLVKYIQKSVDNQGVANLNFICTHNSRRSQFSQVWAKVAANHYMIPMNSHSGGVEITACNERTVASLERFGFGIQSDNSTENPVYTISYDDFAPIECFSKLFDHESSPTENFAAIMTCSHADENCPFIPGADERIPVRYNDPKAFDDTELEASKYDERSAEIASELFYTFSQIK